MTLAVYGGRQRVDDDDRGGSGHDVRAGEHPVAADRDSRRDVGAGGAGGADRDHARRARTGSPAPATPKSTGVFGAGEDRRRERRAGAFAERAEGDEHAAGWRRCRRSAETSPITHSRGRAWRRGQGIGDERAQLARVDPGPVERIGARTARRIIVLRHAVVTLRTRHRAECTDGLLPLLVAPRGRRSTPRNPRSDGWSPDGHGPGFTTMTPCFRPHPAIGSP